MARDVKDTWTRDVLFRRTLTVGVLAIENPYNDHLVAAHNEAHAPIADAKAILRRVRGFEFLDISRFGFGEPRYRDLDAPRCSLLHPR
jgi:hypothetical protein